MSTYNIGGLCWFLYEFSTHLEHLPIFYWINIGKIFIFPIKKNVVNILFILITVISIAGYFYIIYFYIKLRSTDIKAVQRERLSNVKDMNGVAFEAY